MREQRQGDSICVNCTSNEISISGSDAGARAATPAPSSSSSTTTRPGTPRARSITPDTAAAGAGRASSTSGTGDTKKFTFDAVFDSSSLPTLTSVPSNPNLVAPVASATRTPSIQLDHLQVSGLNSSAAAGANSTSSSSASSPGGSQQAVFNRTALRVLEKFVAGFHGCYFCYGQTGSV